MNSTEEIRVAIPQWIEKYGITSMADAGAGDMHWISTLNLKIKYQGYDVFVRRPDILEWDIRLDALPFADVILCRHVLNHLSPEDALKALRLLKGSCDYLMANTGGPKKSVPCVGHFCDYDLDLPPFDLGAPLERVQDCRGDFAIWGVNPKPGTAALVD
jgi:hypothetical protein